MKSIVIYYFSGTGNTEIVANLLVEEILKHKYNVDLIRIEDVLINNLGMNHDKYDLIGIGCQVIGYGAPNLVQRFIKHLPKAKNKKVFIFRTAGGVAPINYNASKPMIRELGRKGYEVIYERVFSIGSNWVVKFDDSVVRQLYKATCKKVAIMFREVINGDRRILTTSIKLKIVMELTMPIFSWILRLVGKDLIVNKNCSLCRLCINNCPSRNIYEKHSRIRFGFSCNSCLRCVYSCPKNAINFRFLRFFPVPGGYNIKKTLSSPCSGDDPFNSPTPPFFKEYVQNDEL